MVNKARTCVYAISLNEIKHVDKFMEMNGNADLVLVCDTGSTDGTVERLRELGAVVYSISQKPWRFDVPRNTALSLIPADIDICLSIDLDEYLQPGWADALELAWQESNGDMKRIAYDYTWNWKEDGTPGIQFFADKVHSRFGYRWRNPCHETLYWEGEGEEIRVTVPDMKLHHHADPDKSRSQYLPLLKMAVDEAPNDDRAAFYYARELYFYGHYEEATAEFLRHLSLPSATWRVERAASYRYLAKCNPDDAENYLVKAIHEDPYRREWLMEMAYLFYHRADWENCYAYAMRVLDIRERPVDYLCEDFAWGSQPHDLAALSAWNTGRFEEAKIQGTLALEKSPNDERLARNLAFYESK